jgi:rhodanese-related sulfurtransferase
MEYVSAADAAERIKTGALLVDIREASERRRLHIAGSIHRPLSAASGPNPADDIIYYCASGMRTRSSAGRLEAEAGSARVAILEGGIQAWAKAGLPMVEDRSAPIDIMRQVMIVAGSLVLIGAILGTFLSPGFYGLSAFVGAGLLFSGVTGFCAMARALSLAPWNR